MLRFAFGIFLAALLGAAGFETVRQTLTLNKVPYDGIVAVVLTAVWVAAFFVSVAFSWTPRRPAKVKAATPDSAQVSIKQYVPPAPAFDPHGPLNPTGSVVMQLRALCREDAQREVAHAFRLRGSESAHMATEIALDGAPGVSRALTALKPERQPRARKSQPEAGLGPDRMCSPPPEAA